MRFRACRRDQGFPIALDLRQNDFLMDRITTIRLGNRSWVRQNVRDLYFEVVVL